MSDPKIADKKPVVMELEPGDYWWCACGHSAKQPFCDGAHKAIGMAPMKFNVAEKKKSALCMCKHTKNPPFCDGVHKSL
ncbi:MAG: CDGSH iron-sulfur domain-containing protein [Nitrospinae bacterium]|nr:CDGSH iron-sulfur domain-containing protein [Nitrospinota bacterium]